MTTIHALIWRSTDPVETFRQEEFDARIPRLMEWLRGLKAGGHLVACGGGGFANHAGGLTVIRADSPERAMELGSGSPMNEIGTTETLVWDVFWGDLSERSHEAKLVET